MINYSIISDSIEYYEKFGFSRIETPVTPCFRYEEFDFLHSKYFIKNELIKTDIVNEKELDKIVEIALKFYQKYIPDAYVQGTSIGYDIEIGGYELGSYGIRDCEFLKWIYGTGVAEPRLSKLITWLTINKK